jgi:hypothetical protein
MLFGYYGEIYCPGIKQDHEELQTELATHQKLSRCPSSMLLESWKKADFFLVFGCWMVFTNVDQEI